MPRQAVLKVMKNLVVADIDRDVIRHSRGNLHKNAVVRLQVFERHFLEQTASAEVVEQVAVADLVPNSRARVVRQRDVQLLVVVVLDERVAVENALDELTLKQRRAVARRCRDRVVADRVIHDQPGQVRFLDPNLVSFGWERRNEAMTVGDHHDFAHVFNSGKLFWINHELVRLVARDVRAAHVFPHPVALNHKPAALIRLRLIRVGDYLFNDFVHLLSPNESGRRKPPEAKNPVSAVRLVEAQAAR